jgi:hypothetical protein
VGWSAAAAVATFAAAVATIAAAAVVATIAAGAPVHTILLSLGLDAGVRLVGPAPGQVEQ